MTDTHRKFMAEIEDFFAAHPEREFLLREIPLSAVRGVAAAGWVVGTARSGSAPYSVVRLHVEPGQTTVLCVIRRPSPEYGPLPGVFLLDGHQAPVPADLLSAVDEEKIARLMWSLVALAEDRGQPLASMIASGVVGYRPR